MQIQPGQRWLVSYSAAPQIITEVGILEVSPCGKYCKAEKRHGSCEWQHVDSWNWLSLLGQWKKGWFGTDKFIPESQTTDYSEG